MHHSCEWARVRSTPAELTSSKHRNGYEDKYQSAKRRHHDGRPTSGAIQICAVLVAAVNHGANFRAECSHSPRAPRRHCYRQPRQQIDRCMQVRWSAHFPVCTTLRCCGKGSGKFSRLTSSKSVITRMVAVSPNWLQFTTTPRTLRASRFTSSISADIAA